MPAPHFMTLELDPTAANVNFGLKALRNELIADKSFTGIHIQVQKGADTQFWLTLQQALQQSDSLLKIKQFSLSLSLEETPQDFSPLMELPFWQELTTLCIDGPIAIACQQQLVNRLQSQTALTLLSATTAMIDTTMATHIVNNLPAGLDKLDLSWNNIDAQNTQQDPFKAFCLAVQQSSLKELGISLKSTLECSAICEKLAKTNRIFRLNAQSTSFMLSTDLDYFIQAMTINPYLTIHFQDILGFVTDQQKLNILEKLTNNNKTPSLTNLGLLRLSELLNNEQIDANKVVQFVPHECISRLPISDALKSQLHQQREVLHQHTTFDSVTRTVEKPNY